MELLYIDDSKDVKIPGTLSLLFAASSGVE